MPRTTLNEIGKRHQTDKSSIFHDYLNRYDGYLGAMADRVRTVLEIGVDGGASLKMWAEYFPGATIYGVDVNPFCAKLDLGKQVSVVIGNARYPEFWDMFFQEHGSYFDLVVDDGSHHYYDQVAALQSLWPHVAPGGLYVVEDLHAAYLKDYNADQPVGSIFNFIVSQYVGRSMNNEGKGQCGKEDGTSNVEFVHFSKSLCFIGKKGE